MIKNYRLLYDIKKIKNSFKDVCITFDLLSESLNTDRQKHLLLELEVIWELTERFMQEYVYQQGIQNSQMIHKELHSFGIDVTKESMNVTL